MKHHGICSGIQPDKYRGLPPHIRPAHTSCYHSTKDFAYRLDICLEPKYRPCVCNIHDNWSRRGAPLFPKLTSLRTQHTKIYLFKKQMMQFFAIDPICQVLLQAAGMTLGIFVGLTVFTFKVCMIAHTAITYTCWLGDNIYACIASFNDAIGYHTFSNRVNTIFRGWEEFCSACSGA